MNTLTLIIQANGSIYLVAVIRGAIIKKTEANWHNVISYIVRNEVRYNTSFDTIYVREF